MREGPLYPVGPNPCVYCNLQWVGTSGRFWE